MPTARIAAAVLLIAALSSAACRGEQSPQGPPAAARDAAPAAPPAPGVPARPHHGIEIIDSHVHIFPEITALAQALEVMEKSGISRFVGFSGGAWGTPRFAATVAMKRVLGDRFEFLCNIDWDDIDSPDFVRRTVEGIERAAAAGARGVKVFKNLGLRVRTKEGRLVPVDDPMLDPIFEAAGRLGLVFAMHVADPVAFFRPVTPDNERFEELSIAESWSFHGKEFPSHAELMAQQERRVARHPKTTFLLVHMGNNAEDLGYVDRLLDRYPNVLVNTAARVPEFGRRPAGEVRSFFIRHQDRILFGSDFVSTPHGMQLGSVSLAEPTIADGIVFFNRHWQYFETADRRIDHPTPIQGRWQVEAVNLPPDVLRKLYHDNARSLFFSRGGK